MSLNAWLCSSLKRLYPSSPAGTLSGFKLNAALNARASAQVGLRLAGGLAQKVRLEVKAPAGVRVLVRRVGYVPVNHLTTIPPEECAEYEGEKHIPGFVPDPLLPENRLLLPLNETHAFWLTIIPVRSNRPGKKVIRLSVIPEKGKPVRLAVEIKYHAIKLGTRKNFRVTHWFYANALFDWYNTDFSKERFWTLLEAYFRNMAQHGQDMIFVPALTPPINGDTRPCQLLKIKLNANRRYSFDWSDVKRYVRLAKKCGFTHFEWNHLFSQWGAKHPVRVYAGQGESERLLFKATFPAMSATYRAFLAQYLDELKRFLDCEGLLEKSFFHLSDEPHGTWHLADYQAARGLLRTLAPWMRIMDALSDIEFAREGLTDLPVPLEKHVLDFIKEGIPCFSYYCCAPKGAWLNHFLDTPLANAAMHGFLHYRWPILGFLHWGYNYWYAGNSRKMINPFAVTDAEKWPDWAHGDPFLVYPGTDGPVDSIRWEIFAEAMQDYALLQKRNVPRNHAMLRSLRSFKEFPKDEIWIRKTRLRLLKG